MALPASRDPLPFNLAAEQVPDRVRPVREASSRRLAGPRIAAGVAAIAVASWVAVGVATSGSSHHAAAAGPTAGTVPGSDQALPPVLPRRLPPAPLPPSLRSAVIEYGDAEQPFAVRQGFPVDSQTDAVATAALPTSQAVQAGPGGALLLGSGSHGGHAIYIDRTGDTVDTGPAQMVVPGSGATAGIARQVGGAVTLQTVTVSRILNTLEVRTGPSVTLPPGDMPVAVLANLRIAVRTEQNQLQVIGPAFSGPLLGQLGAVVGSTAATLAWTGASGCDPVGACPLLLTDLVTGRTRTVAPPSGMAGFAVGGAFSPTGATLLAFAVPPTLPGATLASLSPEFVDVAAGSVTPAGAGVPSRMVQGVPVGIGWWSGDGAYAVYSGLLGTVRATGIIGGSYDLELPGSYALIIL